MAREMEISGEPESAGGIGPPGSSSRRRLLQGAEAAGLTLSATQLQTSTAAARAVGAGPARGATRRGSATATRSAPPVAGLHLQFGADASDEVVVSSRTATQPVRPLHGRGSCG